MSSRGEVGVVHHLVLLGRFAVITDERELVLSQSCQRLMAFVALQPGPALRERIAGRLWPEESHDRAGARLRTALSRLNRCGPRLVTSANGCLELAADVSVDYAIAHELGHRLVDGPVGGDLHTVELEYFQHDLLPDLDEEWVVSEREAFRQLRFAALEALGHAALRAGKQARAIQASLIVVGAEPLRESAHRLLACAYAAEGNVGEAMRQIDQYADLLQAEFALRPSRLMVALRERLTTHPERVER